MASLSKVGWDKVFLFFAIFFILINNVQAQDREDSANISAAKTRAKELCEQDPMNQKCEKLFDSKYRRMKDSEKEVRDIHFKSFDEKHFNSAKQSELRAFCRLNNDSPRCDVLKKNH